VAEKQVELTTEKLQEILNRADFRREFPFLANEYLLSQQPDRKKGCTGCKRKQRRNAANYGKIRNTVAALPPDQKEKLKSMLGVRQVIVKTTDAKGTTKKLKF
jgi:hypothetical protein